MNRKFTRAVAIITLIAMLIATIVFVAITPFSFAGVREHSISETEEFRQFLLDEYKDKIAKESLEGKTIEQMVELLHKTDPYTVVFKGNDTSEKFYELVEGEYMGIGVTATRTIEGIKIVDVNSTGSAMRAGMQIGDIIIAIDGVDVRYMDLGKALDIIKKGKKGTKVRIKFVRENAVYLAEPVREDIKAESVKASMLETAPTVGLIKISGFDSDTAQEFKAAREKLLLAGAKSFVLDLRDNPGGILSEGVAVAEQMMKKGDAITHIVSRGKVENSHYVRHGVNKLYPTVVLINGESASAAEILAAALQDNKAAKLVGTKTYGKGVAQKVIPLANGDSAKVSVNYFTSPSGKTIDKVGVSPDILVYEIQPLDDEEKAKVARFSSMAGDKKFRKGEYGNVILGAQQRLALLGYYKGNLNGSFDQKTADALMSFQKARNLYPYPTLDNTTRKHLESAISERQDDLSLKKDYQLERAVKELDKK